MVQSQREMKENNCVERLLHGSPGICIAIFTFVNFLNYLDRGIISGAGTSIKGCLYNANDCGDLPPLPSCGGSANHSAGAESPAPSADLCGGVQCVAIFKGEEFPTGFYINTGKLGLLQSSFMVGYSLACHLCVGCA